MPGAKDVRTGSRRDWTAYPATLVPAARGRNRLRGPSPRSAPPLPSGHRHLRPRAPAGPRDPRAPPTERALSRRGAPTPQPRAPGRSSRVATPEGGGIRSPAGSEREPPTGAGDLRGPGGARRGAGEPESPGRPLKPAGPRWPAAVRGSRVSVPALAAAVSSVLQVPFRGLHRGHTASRPSRLSPHPKVSPSAAGGLTWDALSDRQWSFTSAMGSCSDGPSELGDCRRFGGDCDLSPPSVPPGPRPCPADTGGPRSAGAGAARRAPRQTRGWRFRWE